MKQLRKFLILPALLASVLVLSGCERPPIEAVQHGFRGTAMDLIYNPRILAEQAENNAVPASYGPAPADGPKAGAVYKNVKVLNNLSVAQFTAFMVSMTSWVAPEQGCTYCHNSRNFSSWEESPPQRAKAWYAIRMAQDINNNYMEPITGLFPPHRLGPTGDVAKANCGTCHQGAYKPLYGVSMLSDYPFLTGPAKPPLKGQDSPPSAKSVAMK